MNIEAKDTDQVLKSYKVEWCVAEDGTNYIKRTAYGFDAMEIVGFLEDAKMDILAQLKRESPMPTIKERIVDTKPNP